MPDREEKRDSSWKASSPPTSTDVARLAQVSRATVSYVLNNAEGARISEETRNRVLKAAAQLGYIPHKIASSLRSGHSDLILLPFFDWPYNQSSITFLQEMALQLDQLGYTVMLRFFHRGDKSQVVEKIAAFHPIGVIVTANEFKKADVELLKRNGVKAVLAYQGSPTASLPYLTYNFEAVGEYAAKYLISRGYRQIAAIVPRDERILQMGLQRLEGMDHIARRHEISIQRIDLAFDNQEIRNLVAPWKTGIHPQAIFTYNDEYGGLLMSALGDEKIKVPQDIALLGCDNLPLCEMLRPQLSSIDLGSSQHAKEIADYFHRMIEGEQLRIPPVQPPACKLIVRESA
jgi:DNA-binding LacI/PurR family transcriptional regulator